MGMASKFVLVNKPNTFLVLIKKKATDKQYISHTKKILCCSIFFYIFCEYTYQVHTPSLLYTAHLRTWLWPHNIAEKDHTFPVFHLSTLYTTT